MAGRVTGIGRASCCRVGLAIVLSPVLATEAPARAHYPMRVADAQPPRAPRSERFDPDQKTAQRLPARKFKTYSKKIDVIGPLVAAADYPWQVSIKILVNGSYKPCGGIIIAPRFVLTAAHCLDNAQALDHSTVARALAQSIEIYHGDSSYGQGRRLLVDPTWGPNIHPMWKRVDATPLAHDIALIRLAVPLSNATPAPLHIVPVGPGRSAVVSGWGHFDSSNQSSTQLRAIAVPLIDNAACIARVVPDRRSYVTATTLCTESADFDACSGDSGGPLVIGSRNRPQTVGIVSWGSSDFCAVRGPSGTLIGGYTRASEIADWVRQTAADSSVVTSATPEPLFTVKPIVTEGPDR